MHLTVQMKNGLFSVPSVQPTVLEDLFNDLWLLYVKELGEY